jgi:hypothetical protein
VAVQINQIGAAMHADISLFGAAPLTRRPKALFEPFYGRYRTTASRRFSIARSYS